MSDLECEESIKSSMESNLRTSCISNGKCAKPMFEFENADLNSFSKPNVGELQGFIAVRTSENAVDLRKIISLMPGKKIG